MSNPNWIVVDVEPHLNDCPPYDEEIEGIDIAALAKEVCARFDYSLIFDSIDTIALTVLREKGLIQ
jgi:hypothetical protein